MDHNCHLSSSICIHKLVMFNLEYLDGVVTEGLQAAFTFLCMCKRYLTCYSTGVQVSKFPTIEQVRD